MNWTETLFGHGIHLSVLQMSCRAFVTFFVTLLLLRVAGIRTFGKKTAFDTVIVIMLGSVFSRVVVGASPFIATTVASFVFVAIHWMLAKLSFYSDLVGRFVKGEKLILFRHGEFNRKNMSRAAISKKDLEESLRLIIHGTDWEKVKEIIIERTGEISILET